MPGVNEALLQLKQRLDLADARVADSRSREHVAMSGKNPYLSFRPLGAYLRAEEQFRLEAATRQLNYPEYVFSLNLLNLSRDSLGFGSYMATYKPGEWADIQEHYDFILGRIEKHIGPIKDRVAVPNKRMQRKIEAAAKEALALAKLKEEDIRQIMNQQVQLGDNASIKVYANREFFRDTSFSEYVLDASRLRWEIHSRLSASMPCQVDEEHPLVVGVANNLAFVELSMPVEDPSIFVAIEKKTEQATPDTIRYYVKLKDSGVDEETLERMMKLLLI